MILYFYSDIFAKRECPLKIAQVSQDNVKTLYCPWGAYFSFGLNTEREEVGVGGRLNANHLYIMYKHRCRSLLNVYFCFRTHFHQKVQ